ncbi:MAG: hypothetical protein ACKOGA_23500 [Planctomycetaceae bacterium]
MTEAEREIIGLLTEIRDESRAESLARKSYMEQSFALSRRAARQQRVALVLLLTLVGAALVWLIWFSRRRPWEGGRPPGRMVRGGVASQPGESFTRLGAAWAPGEEFTGGTGG